MKSIKNLLLPLFLIVILVFVSCENEPYEGLIGEKIQVDSELYLSLEQLAGKSTEKDTVCVVFVYPFNVYLYDDNEEISGSRIVENNLDFVSLLDSMDSGAYVGLSYPISTVTDDGENFIINNNEELKDAIKACIEEEIIGNCNGILEEECLWTIASLTSFERYDASIIDFYANGEGVFYDEGTSYRMSWISLFIEDELHVNIKLEGDSEVAKDWNFDWRATILSDTSLELFRDNRSYIITTNCDLTNNCDYVEFKECELEFNLDNYIECISSLQDEIELTENVKVSFYETKEDQQNNTNELDKTSYTPKKNPQIVFVTLEDPNIGLSKNIQIVLVTTACKKSK